MTGKIQFLFISTFFMGVFAGAYFYVSFYAPMYENNTPSGVVSKDTFVINATMYGGCERLAVCASFQLIEGGTYSFIPGGSRDRETGKLSRTYTQGIQRTLTLELLSQLETDIRPSSCSSYADGVDYHYSIKKDGVSYEIDTCTTALSSNRATQELFLDIWYALENPHLVVDQPSTFDIAEFLKDRFQNPPQ
jgi:hypothetical protein